MRSPLFYSFLCVATLHAFAVFAFMQTPQQNFGTSTKETTAISLNLAETLVIEETPEEKTIETEAVQATLDETVGQKVESAPAEPEQKKREQEKPIEQETREEPQKKQKKVTVSDYVPFEPIKLPPKIQKKVEKQVEKPKPQKKVTKKPTPPKKKGGAKARTQKKTKQKKRTRSARLSASKGQIRSYNALLRAHIARHKPRDINERGTSVISFGVDRNGRLRYARLHKSSGNASLDQASLRAIKRAAPFPRPPQGMTLRQLSLKIPFRFR